MNILITGAAGFVGKNLTAALECIRDGKDRTHPGLTIGELYLYDIDSPAELLEEACSKADFVFNLAGVNRPQNQEEFMQGNFGFASRLLETTLSRICAALKLDEQVMLANSFMISADNAHAVHPNHPEYADSANAPVVNGGVVLKFNANQRYTTDGFSAAVLRSVCAKAGVPVQT